MALVGIGFRTFDQAVVSGTGFGTLRDINKKPVAPANSERADSIFRCSVADVKVAIFTVHDQLRLLVQGIAHGFMGKAVRHQTGDVFLQPLVKVIQQRLVCFLPAGFFPGAVSSLISSSKHTACGFFPGNISFADFIVLHLFARFGFPLFWQP